MNKNSIIIYSAIIIAIFALLYYLENPEPKPKSETKNFMRKYEGKKGFSIIKVPDFLVDEFMQNDSLKLDRSSFKSFRLMILHENQDAFSSCLVTETKLIHFLDSLKFQPIFIENQDDSTQMKIYNKNIMDAWKENVTVYASDSTLFLFNFIADIEEDQIIEFSTHLSNQNIL